MRKVIIQYLSENNARNYLYKKFTHNMNIVDQITERVLSKLTEDTANSDGWASQKRKAYDAATFNNAVKRKRDINNIHKQNKKTANDVKQQNTTPTSNVDFTSKPFKGIVTKECAESSPMVDPNTKITNKVDMTSRPYKRVVKKEAREKLIKQITEIKSTIDKISQSVPQSVLEEAKYQNFMKKLNEYMSIDDYGQGDYGEFIVDENQSGDDMLDAEMSQITGSPTSDAINSIMKQSLSAMSSLSDNSQSPEFQTMNNIFIQCQKYNSNKKSDSIVEGDKVVPNNSIKQ